MSASRDTAVKSGTFQPAQHIEVAVPFATPTGRRVECSLTLAVEVARVVDDLLRPM